MNNGYNYALYKSCLKNSKYWINYFIKKDADVDVDYGLYGACEGGHLEIVNLMLQKGANDCNYGLCGACEGGHLDIINTMIEKGANDWDSGLLKACKGGHLEIVNLMLKKGADKLSDGLGEACLGGHVDIVNLMNKLCKDRKYDDYCTVTQAEAYRYGIPNFVPTLLSEAYESGFLKACEGGQIHIVNMMLKKMADTWCDEDDIEYKCTDIFACKCDHTDIANMLIKRRIIHPLYHPLYKQVFTLYEISEDNDDDSIKVIYSSLYDYLPDEMIDIILKYSIVEDFNLQEWLLFQ